jgi:tetratricopeptide (TPR) repeat protein
MNRFRSVVIASILAIAGLAVATPVAVAQAPAVTASASTATSRPLVDVLEQAELGVVVVLVKDAAGKPESQGSGFFIDERHVITNRHVVEDGSHAEVKLKNGRTYAVAGIVAEDTDNDLVLLRVNIPRDAGHRPLTINASEPRKGTEVYVLGAPRGLEFSVSRGIVSAIRAVSGMTSDRVVQTDASISPGNSGGPLINAAGEVVGVASFIRTDGENLGFAQGAWHVAALRAGSMQTLAQWQSGRAEEYYQHARMAYGQKRYAEAIPLLVKVVQSRPEHPAAWFQLGFALDEVGKKIEAIAAFERHLRTGVAGAAAAETLFNIGIISKQVGQEQRAKQAFEEALEHDPRYGHALLQLGLLSWKAQNWQEVVTYYSRLLEVQPGNTAVRADLANAINNIGAEDARAGRPWTAVRRFQEAMQVDPNNNLARLNLGLTAHDLGYGGTVREMYQELLVRDDALAAKLRPFLP